MNNFPKHIRRSESGAMSAEALIGLGITIGALGLLCLLLGWAQHMRQLPTWATFWVTAGVAMVVVGGILAALARSRGTR